MHPALFYRPGQPLSLPELSAARLDGHVFEVGEGFMPADTVESNADRAVSIADLLPPRTAASGHSAAWIHGASDQPPRVHHATRIDRSRPRTYSSTRIVYHEHHLDPGDVQLIGGVAVTTPLCTATTLLFDLARAGGDDRWLRGLLGVFPRLDGELRAHVVPLSGRPGSRTANQILARMLADQEVVTR
ncbi:SAM-dependent methyltransferase [Microbacterium esteraromaticum]|uniref:SAM-dependent methyltransferase n=1 Tax=Microbacterium esteraromaticum TaxID=57043 RepID=UPI001C95FFCD|nr:SAM-dependent methyltransferase [Microbacterium esteraromaticum]MBY6061219.1 SAM-dependent methyltransferase [Microbacterium esteraromaticum]